MAVFLNDRQRVELGLPIHMMMSALIAGANDPQISRLTAARPLLGHAAAESLSDLPHEHRMKLVRRVGRLHQEILMPFRGEPPSAARLGLVAFYLLRAIVDSGFLIVGEASFLAKALGLMLPVIESQMDANTENIAKRQAKAHLTRLQSLGYYDDPAVMQSLDG